MRTRRMLVGAAGAATVMLGAAVCRNGQEVYGDPKWATGGWSYAYCAGKGGLTSDLGYKYWRAR